MQSVNLIIIEHYYLKSENSIIARSFWKPIHFIIATIWHTNFSQPACPFIIIITSEFTLFIPAWITSPAIRARIHVRPAMRESGALSPRDYPMRLADLARPTRHYQSTSGISRDVCSYRTARDMEMRHPVIKGVTHARFLCARCYVATAKVIYATRSPTSFATRETCSREIWRDLETHHFFFLPFLRPRNLISATPAQRCATRTAFPFVVKRRELYELLHRNDATWLSPLFSFLFSFLIKCH